MGSIVEDFAIGKSRFIKNQAPRVVFSNSEELSHFTPMRRNVRYWHLVDISKLPRNVRFRGVTGHAFFLHRKMPADNPKRTSLS